MHGEPWNHNLHYHRLILAQVPSHCGQALDIGCGDGVLSVKLAGHVKDVLGIDRSAEMIDRARQRAAGITNLDFTEGDFLADSFPSERFDFIVAVAVIHHMPFGRALRRMEALLRPGGVLVVVGLALVGSLRDTLLIPAAWTFSRIRRHRSGWWESGAPHLEPEMTYDEIFEQARAILPGVEVRRRLLFRYTLVWRKPSHNASPPPGW